MQRETSKSRLSRVRATPRTPRVRRKVPCGLLLLALLLPALCSRAAQRLVTNGLDYDAGDPPIANSLRGELELAQPGDTISIARNLIVNLFDRLVIPAGKDHLTITGPEDGPAQIRAIIEPGENSQFNSILVQGDDVIFRKLTFRDVTVTIGDSQSSVLTVEGGTVQDCSFTQRSSLMFANMNGGLAERCTLNVAPFNEGLAAIEVAGGDGTVVRNCTITLLGSAGSEEALSANGGTNLRFEQNTLVNGDLRFWAKNGWILRNVLPNRVLDLTLTDPVEGPGPYEFAGNTCGALIVKARNFAIRENVISGKVTGRTPPAFQVVGGNPQEKPSPVSLHLVALDGTQPITVTSNVVNGGINGVSFSLQTGSATFSRNQIRNATLQGMIVNADAPMEISFNLFEKCGGTKLAFSGLYPSPALHLRDINAAVVVKENVFTDSRGAAILAHDGSPVLEANHIARGTAAGMMFYGPVTPVFEGINRIEQMKRAGVVVKNGATVTVERVTFERNGICGLSVEPGANATARDCTFTAQMGPGVKLATEFKAATNTYTARALVETCTFEQNLGAGVLIGKGGACEVSGSQFTDNLAPGIDIAPPGVTRNTLPKQANGDLDYPEQLTFDEATRTLRGKAEPGARVEMYRTEKNRRRGNPNNGEGTITAGTTTATIEGDFALPTGPTVEGDMFTFTATRAATGGRPAVTSEFSDNIEVPPSPPIELISQSSNEDPGNDVSIVNDWNVGPAPQELMANTSVSADARFVLFHSVATNLVDGDSNDAPDLFLRDRASGTTERVNVASSGAQAGPNFAGSAARVGHGSLSSNGRWVVFASDSVNLVADDGNSATDIFLRDRQTGTTIAVTDPTEHPELTSRLQGGSDCSISADGSVVAFVTTEHRFTNTGTPGSPRVLVWLRSTGQFEEVSVPETPGVSGFYHSPRLSADGRFVVFFTRAQLVAADTDSRDDIYLRDRQAGTTERLSVATDGTALGGMTPSISADGRFVAFSSPGVGDPADTNNQRDIYVRDRQTGTTTWASQPPAGLTNPNLGRNCLFPSLSADGRYVTYQGLGISERPNQLSVFVTDIYVRDRQVGVTIEASIGVAGDARGDSQFPVMSPDGQQVIFESEGVGFTAGDVQTLSEVFARTLRPGDFAAP